MKRKRKNQQRCPEYILISVDRENCNRISSLIVPLYGVQLQCHSILLFCSPYKKQQKPLWLGSGSPASDSVDDNSQQRAHLQDVTNHPKTTPSSLLHHYTSPSPSPQPTPSPSPQPTPSPSPQPTPSPSPHSTPSPILSLPLLTHISLPSFP